MFIKRVFIFSSLLILLSGCFSDINESTGCKVQEKEIALRSSEGEFKKEVLYNFSEYKKLKDFIISNLSVIFAYNEQGDNLSTPSFGNHTANYRLRSFTFHDYGKGNMIKDQVPWYLYPKLRTIYTAFNQKNFYSVSFDRDSTVTVLITNPSKSNSQNVIINHRLVWKNHKTILENQSSSLSRNMDLADGWVYTVFIDCNEGI